MSNKCRFSANSRTHHGMPSGPAGPSAAAQEATPEPATLESLAGKVERIEIAMGAWSTASMAQQQQISLVENKLDLLRIEMNDKFNSVEDRLERLHQDQELIKSMLDLILQEVRDLKGPAPNR